MYKIVSVLLALGLALQGLNFLRTLFGPGVSQLGLSFPPWAVSLGMAPSLFAGILVLVLFMNKNAVAFWAYLPLTILAFGTIINLILTLPAVAETTITQNSTAAILNIANLVLIAVFLFKLAICWMMWKLMGRGELRYPSSQ